MSDDIIITQQDISPAAQNKWETTPRGKIICPECGMSGYHSGTTTKGSWVRSHAAHIKAACGKVVSFAGRARHERTCKVCKVLP